MKFSKTEAGQQAFKARSALLSVRQRSAFILFDGVKSTAQVLAATSGLGIDQGDIDHLIQQGFLVGKRSAAAAPSSSASDSPADEPQTELVSERSTQERYSAAVLIATKLTASLGLRGFRLNLAVEGARGYDDLLALLPKIQATVGAKSCVALEQALKG